MGYGLINVCSDQCGTKTYIADKINGFIFDPSNKLKLTDILNLLLTNEHCFKEVFYNVQKSLETISKNNYYKYFLNMINDKFSKY